MDDTYLKMVFWTMVALYTVAIIGLWENIAKPIWVLVSVLIMPFLGNILNLTIK